MKFPTLSVLMTNYNHARFLPESLGAILNQSFRPKEIIIIDDASTDQSVAIIENFLKNKHPIRLIRNDKNMGVVCNLNRLLEIASGDYVYFAAADDKVLPGFLEKSLHLLNRYPQAGLCSTQSLMIDAEGKDKGLIVENIRTGGYLNPKMCLWALNRPLLWIHGNSAIYRRQALIEEGGFKEKLGFYCDGFLHQVLALRYGVCFIPEPLAAWRHLDSGYSVSILANFEQSLEIYQHAGKLMRSTYQDLFPPEYVEKWLRQSFYNLGSGLLNQRIRQQEIFQAEFLNHLLPYPSRCAKILSLMLRLSRIVQNLIFRLSAKLLLRNRQVI